MDKVVVVGGSGFLGSHLSDSLSDSGYRVVIYDMHESLWLRPDQESVVGTLEDRNLLEKTISGAKYVYHLAGIAEISGNNITAHGVVTSNIMGSVNVIEACRSVGGVERFVFASSVYVYSDKGSFYRVSKQAVELLLEVYNKEYGLPYTILRYGSLYGPRSQDWNGLRSRIKQAVREGRIDYPGTGKELREYIHVMDAARLSVEALSADHENACFTLTGTQVLSSEDLLNLINEIMGGGLKLNFIPCDSEGHYGLTPYRYTPRAAQKMIPTRFYDLGQGVLELIEDVKRSL